MTKNSNIKNHPNQPLNDDKFDELAFSLAIFGMWIIAPILTVIGWPVAKMLVEAAYGAGWIDIVQLWFNFGSLVLAYTGLYVGFQITLPAMYLRLSNFKK